MEHSIATATAGPLNARTAFSSCPHCVPLPPLQVIEDFGLLAFHPLAIEDRQSVAALAALIDKSNGFVFAGLARPGGFAPLCAWTSWWHSVRLGFVHHVMARKKIASQAPCACLL